MAKIYDEKEIKDLERQAALKQRQDAAMKILEPEKPDPVATMREHEAQRRADWHKSNMDARARRLEGMVATEAGRYNPQQQAAALKWLEGNGYGQEGERRRQFDVTNETTRKVSENEMNGKINYGNGAAEVKAGADITMNKNEWETRAKIAEQEAAAKKYLAETEAQGSLNVEKQRGLNAKELEIERGRTVIDGGELKNEGALRVQQEQNKGNLDVAQVQAQAAADAEQRAHGNRMRELALKQAGQRLTDVEVLQIRNNAQKNGTSFEEEMENFIATKQKALGGEK